MAENNSTKKFLNYEGVSTLWSRIAAEIKAEADRAAAAELLNKNAAEAAQTAANTANASIGTLDSLNTTKKDNLVNAINEVRQAVEVGGTGSVVNMTKSDDGLTYTLTQGSGETATTIGTIDIPKDMVVTNGSVVVDPEGQAAGTYIKLVLANVADPLYINVGTLVDLYTATENATQVQVAVDNTSRKISASIVAGSVNTTELADNAVTTVKIADGNVTKEKLSTGLQASIDLADSAVQKVETGSADGTIAVDGTDVAVKGLGTAAYKNVGDFDSAGLAAAAEAAAKAYTDEQITNNVVAMSDADIDAAIAAAKDDTSTLGEGTMGDAVLGN